MKLILNGEPIKLKTNKGVEVTICSPKELTVDVQEDGVVLAQEAKMYITPDKDGVLLYIGDSELLY